MKALTLSLNTKKNWEPVIHILILSYFIGEKWVNNGYGQSFETKFFFAISSLTLPVLFYLNAFWLIPKFLNGRKIIYYLLILIGSIVLLDLIRTFCYIAIFHFKGAEFELIHFQKYSLRHYSSLSNFIFSFTSIGIALSFAYRFTKDWVIHEKEKQKLLSDKLSAELKFLKSQLNPHFLFNTLNNLFSFSIKENCEKTGEGIANLSQLMRYSLLDANQEYVVLEKEINFIRKFIDLQKLRIAEDNPTEIKIKIDGNFDSAQIVPMILIPFIENAFQHGISFKKGSFIELEIRMHNQTLSMEVKNSINKNMQDLQGSGIGLNNVKSRLEILYKNRYKLIIKEKPDQYHVFLQISLK